MFFNFVRTRLKNILNNENDRIAFVKRQLEAIENGKKILDAGCGSQQYRKFCSHLNYKAQDFGSYVKDTTQSFTSGLGGESGYQYGPLDYIGDIWSIQEEPGVFDAVLCTEVFEHIPYPNETIYEFSRLLKPGGKLILTLPSNCLRHMDPYFFYSGFSNRYLEHMLNKAGFEIISLDTIGDYYSWISTELARTINQHGFFAKLFLTPAFVWFFRKKKTFESENTLCMGYHVVAHLK